MRPQHSAQCSTVTHKSGTLWLRSMVNSARNRRRLASPWVGEEGGGGRALLTGEPDGGAGAGGRGRGVVLGGAGQNPDRPTVGLLRLGGEFLAVRLVEIHFGLQ